MGEKLKIYVGYDSREDIAWQVCRFSLLRHASANLEIYPLKQMTVRELGIYTRGPDKASTEFSLTRFLTPYLAAHDGWTIFVDCDFLFTTDVMKVLKMAADGDKAVYVVKHAYTPANAVKMDGRMQTAYPRKNWSSFMLFNNRHSVVKALTPAIVNRENPAFLHRFSWIDDQLIGELPRTWNFLEGEYPKPDQTPNAIHYTNGGPWFPNKQNVDYAELWCAERDMYLASVQRALTV